MHTYKNNGSNTITYKGITWEPGEEHAVSFFVPHGELGLTKTSDTPEVDAPVIIAQKITLAAGAPQAVSVPYTGKKIVISAVVAQGQTATIAIGNTTPAITIDDTTGAYVSPPQGFEWGHAAQITLESAAGADVYLLVEEV
jgi:hypothetical protein